MRALLQKVRRCVLVCLAMTVIFFGQQFSATTFESIRGVVHDPQHKPVASASVVLKAMASDWSQKQETTPDGEFY